MICVGGCGLVVVFRGAIMQFLVHWDKACDPLASSAGGSQAGHCGEVGHLSEGSLYENVSL